MSDSFPLISIIIPTTRSDLLPHTLRTVCMQDYPGKIEIIVVGTFVARLSPAWPIIAIATGEPTAPGRARNLGAQRASGEILIFLDDDCLVPPDWITRNIDALWQQRVGAVGTRIRGLSRAFFARCTDFASFGDFQHGWVRDMPLAAASLGVWREIYEQAGGFDDTMRAGEEEDTDLCHRIQCLGYRTLYRPDIVILHDHRRDTLTKLLRHTYHQGVRRGLATKRAYRRLQLRNRLLSSVDFPPLFLVCVPLIALAATGRIILFNVKEHVGVLVYAPFIFLSKLTYNYGIYQNLIASSGKGQ